jgi:predicted MFS family arabinose efflux permease
MASGSASLALGVALAGASAGFCWTPFNDAAERIVPAKARPGALSAVSTGTTIGISAAGALFIGVTFGVFEWRAAWIVFALYGVFVALAAGFGLPETARSKALADDAVPGLLRRVALPLYAAALCFGATNAIYLSFAADRVVNAGGLAGLPDTAASAVIFLGYGICGVIGLATGWIEARIGLAPLLAAIFAAFVASLALVALIPGSWAGVVVSAGLHGAAVMTISAILSFWSLRLFPGRGSLGFTATLVGAATGSVLGPALAGALADAAGGQVAFLAAAAVPLAAALAFACRSSDSLS